MYGFNQLQKVSGMFSVSGDEPVNPVPRLVTLATRVREELLSYDEDGGQAARMQALYEEVMAETDRMLVYQRQCSATSAIDFVQDCQDQFLAGATAYVEGCGHLQSALETGDVACCDLADPCLSRGADLLRKAEKQLQSLMEEHPQQA